MKFIIIFKNSAHTGRNLVEAEIYFLLSKLLFQIWKIVDSIGKKGKKNYNHALQYILKMPFILNVLELMLREYITDGIYKCIPYFLIVIFLKVNYGLNQRKTFCSEYGFCWFCLQIRALI